MDTEIMSGNEHTTNLEDGLEMVKRTRQDSVGGENHTIIQVDDPVHGTGDTHTTSEIVNVNEENDDHVTPSLVHDVASRGQLSNSTLSPRNMIHESNCNTKISIWTTLLVLVVGSIYTSTFNMKDSPIVNKAFLLGDFVFHPSTNFYLMMFMAVAFTLSMVAVVILTWSMISKWSFCSKGLLVIGLGSFFLSYAFIVAKKVPKFWVIINESFKISSFWMVWLYVISLLIFIVVTSNIVKLYVVWRATSNQPREE